jgi:hypothetical protein
MEGWKVGVMRGKERIAAVVAASCALAGPAWADAADLAAQAGPISTSPEVLTVAERWEQEFQALRARLMASERRIEALEAEVRGAKAQIAALQQEAPPSLMGGLQSAFPELLASMQAGSAAPVTAAGASPVGEAPPSPDSAANVIAALPDNTGVLTPPGRTVFEPTLNYTNSASNRLVFRGVEIVTGVQVGVIEADTVARDTMAATATIRHGLTRRSEIELRVPYIYRNDRITTLAQRDEQQTRTMRLNADGIGDVELTGRYQLTGGGLDRPIVVANLRVKSDTGSSPYEVARDNSGVAQELAVGSGFWAVEPSLSALIVTDPAVIFGNLSWLHSFPKRIDRTVGEVLVGKVTPGDSIGASLGFGFSLNPRFSFSLGYRHNYIFRTSTELGGTVQWSEALHIGSMLFGMSYRVTPSRSINTQFEFGVTSDAPSMAVTLRTPFVF